MPNKLDDPVFDVVVIGAGAAGLLAAARAAELGRRVLLLEKNRKAGVKILMSGGTRCNLTQAVDGRGIIQAFGKQGRFLHSPLAALSPDALVELVEAEGVPTKIEETGKIFPESDKAADVLSAFLRRLKRSGAELALGEAVVDLYHIPRDREGNDKGKGGSNNKDESGGFEITTARRTLFATSVIVTTGGQSYPGCGTTGDGYRWLQELGHTIVPPRPALTPIKTRADWAKSLRGVTLADVVVRVVEESDDNGSTNAASSKKNGSKGSRRGVLDERRGGLLFAHFGMSGPAVLDVSRAVTLHTRPRSLRLVCDFWPEVSGPQLTDGLQQLANSQGKKQIAGLLAERLLPGLPRRLINALLEQAGVPALRRVAELSKAERNALVGAVKEMRIPITGTLGFEKAEVTAGGVALSEVDSSDMQSKLMPRLFLAGEVLDLDGPIGGYNFQAAFSTGFLAGESAAEE